MTVFQYLRLHGQGKPILSMADTVVLLPSLVESKQIAEGQVLKTKCAEEHPDLSVLLQIKHGTTITGV